MSVKVFKFVRDHKNLLYVSFCHEMINNISADSGCKFPTSKIWPNTVFFLSRA